ncbi:MAG: hypothetical protein K2M41_08395 [Muribaculaceae bacterium]|nr:hypothetical protein [Muribaculaceae bacterium]
MKKIKRYIALAIAGLISAAGVYAQNSAPAPGSGGSFNPAPSNGIGWNPGPGQSAPAPGSGGGFNPGPPAGGPMWGGPWGGGWNSSPSVIVNVTPNVMNNGITNVVGVGYDAQGIWRTVPMRVAYSYNGAYYNVQVLSAWNPWTDMWNRNVDQQAFNTSYFLRGQTYDFYVPLTTGTYYFNL